MALDENDLKTLEEKFFKPFKESTDEISKKLKDLETNQIPGMITRLVSKGLEGVQKTPPIQEQKPNPNDPPKDKTNAALSAELDALKKAWKEEKVKAQVATALSKHKLVVGSEGMVIEGILKGITENENGEFGTKIKKKLEASGGEAEEFINIDASVNHFLNQHKFFRLGSIQGGTGASGGQGFDESVKPSFPDMLKDPNLMAFWQKKDAAYVTEAQAKHIEALQTPKR